MNQPTLFEFRQRFAAWKQFHAENPYVFVMFRRFAIQAKQSGRPRFGARMIGERIRWYTAIETTGKDYRINDHHWPYYARLLVAIDPEFEGFFTFKDERFDATVSEIVAAHRRGEQR